MKGIEEVFETAVFEMLESGKWLARGRAYEDIHIGDVLFARVSTGEVLDYKVIGITTYRREIDELNSGLTGDLTLAAIKHLKLHEKITMLYRSMLA